MVDLPSASGDLQPTPGPKSNGAFLNGQSFTSDPDVHILDRLAILYKYQRIVITVFVLVMVVMMMGPYTAVPFYRAQARLQIDDERSTTVPGMSDTMYWQDPEPYFQTQYKILQGRDLARRAAARLDLARVPEFNGQGPKPAGIGTAVASVGQWVKAKALGAPPAPAAAPVRPADPAEYADQFMGRVRVEQIRGSRLVDVGFTAYDPAFAAMAVNTLVTAYVEQNLEQKMEAARNMLSWVNAELAKQQDQVTESQRALAEYREQKNAMALEDRNNIIVARLNQLNDAVTRARTERLHKATTSNQLTALGPDNAGAENLAIIAANPNVQARKTTLNDLTRKQVADGERYGPGHPTIRENATRIADAQKQLDLEIARTIQTIKNEYESAVIDERELTRQLEEQKDAAMDLSRKSVDYSVLQHKAESDQQVYESLLQRQKELSIQSNSRTNNVRIVEPAGVPKSPQAPSAQRTWLLALLVSLVLSVGVAFGLDYMNDTIKTPEDLTRRLKVPVLGLVPAVSGAEHPVLSSPVPHDFGEAFRALRTSLVASYASEATRVLLVTSAQPLEGKTTTAANLAMALACGGARVLLIDADMRRPGVQRTLEIPNEKGLSHLLVGQSRFREVIQRTADPNLLVITAGRTPPNPSELLSSPRMKALLTNLATGPFDWVIVDTPPVLAVTDAVILAPLVSGALFVVGAEMTRRRLAERALETLLAGRPKAMGAVLNRVDFARNRYYYSRYYGYQHKSYYAEATV